MSRICWWLANILSRALESGENDAVLGDLAESSPTGAQALFDVLDIVVRRQMAWWRDWRAWMVFAGLVVPLGLLLSLISDRVAAQGSIYSWMYFNNLDWTLVEQRAFWIGLLDTIRLVLPDMLALICLAWTTGLLLRAVSRRPVPVNGILFCLASLIGQFAVVPQYMRLQLTYVPGLFERHLHDNDAVFSLTFYRVIFPLLLQIVLVLLPFCCGMYRGLGRTTLLLRTILWAPSLVIMAELAAMQAVWWGAVANHNWLWIGRSWQLPPLQFALIGPVVYVASLSWKSWRPVTLP